jgi:hypothetical protein
MTEQETPTATELTPPTLTPVIQDGTGRKPGTFLPGDRRINRKGRPKSFAQLRETVLRFLAEQDDDASGTRLDTILRELAANDPKTLLEYGFGKVPTRLEGIGLTHSTIIVKHHHEITDNHPAVVTPSTD